LDFDLDFDIFGEVDSELPQLTYEQVKNSFKLPPVYKKILEELEAGLKGVVVKGGRGGIKTSFGTIIGIIFQFHQLNYNTDSLIFRQYKTSLEGMQSTFIQICKYSSVPNLIDYFVFKKNEIVNKQTGGKWLLQGLRESTTTTKQASLRTLDKIKNFNNVSYIFGEEASGVNEEELRITLPTARAKNGVKMFFAMNQILEKDPILRYFESRTDTKIYHINIFDLPLEFQSKVILHEFEQDKIKLRLGNISEELFNHTWYGMPHPELQGRPFESKKVVNFTGFNYQFPVQCFIDPSLKGVDYTAIAIGYYDDINNHYYIGGYCIQKGIEHCIDELKAIMEKHGVSNGGYEDNIMGYELGNRFDIPMQGFTTTKAGGRKEDKIYSARIFNLTILDFEHHNNNNMGIFAKQVKEYEKGAKYDDAPDSLFMLIEYMGY
jgi:hypothetical protein